jgi:3-phenylpropionate/trans-cinnamate dioxygenase ferredoxin subunit
MSEEKRENIPGLNNGFGPEAPLDYAFAVIDEAKPAVAKRGRRINIGAASKIAPGEKKIIDNGEISFGVFNIKGQFYAIKNVCPHAGAPLCQGHIQTTHRPSDVGEFDPALEGRILRCPWHGWEFDIVTGKGLYDRNGRVATYPCEVDENGNLIVML